MPLHALTLLALAQGLPTEPPVTDTPVTDTLVLDIDTTPSFGDTFDPEPQAVGSFGDGRLLFTAQPNFLERRVYFVTDGTPGGSQQLFLDGLTLQQPSAPLDLPRIPGATLPDGRVVFSGSVGFFEGQATVTDGTSAGTLALGDTSPFQNAPAPIRYTAHQGEVWYLGYSTVGFSSDLDLFATDGTVAGTSKRVELPLANGFAHDDVGLLHSDGNLLLIAHSRIEAGAWVTDLWRSAGTSGSTDRFATLQGRASSGDSGQPYVDRHVLLLAPDETTPPSALWAVDVASGALELLTSGDTLAFARGDGARLWFATAGPDGPALLYGEPGAPGAPGALLQEFDRLSISAAGEQPSDVALVNGLLLFGAEGEGDATGLEPWRSDGTAGGTRLLGDLEPGNAPSRPHGFTARGAQGFFGASTATVGAELFRTAGAPGDVQLVTDLTPGPEGGLDPGRLVAAAGDVTVFGYAFSDLGPQLAATTPAGAALAAEIGAVLNQGSNPRELFAYGERLLFSAFRADLGFEPWISDGTAAGTQLFLDLAPGPVSSGPAQWLGLGDRLFFSTFTTSQGREVWSTDGTPAGTEPLADAVPGPAGSVADLTASDDWLFFVSQEFGVADRIWRSDGTPAGTAAVADLGTPSNFSARVLQVFGDTALVHAEDSAAGAPDLGRELYLVDAVSGARELLVDYNAGPDNSTLQSFANAEGFTLAVLKVPGTRLIVSDGTLAGSGELTSPNFPPSLFDSFIWGAWRDTVFFSTGNGDLWATDGTTAGTERLAPFQTLGGGASDFDGRGQFAVFQDQDRNVWRSDGTAAGTLLLEAPQSAFGPSQRLRTPAGTEGAFVYVDSTPEGGEELWLTAGTPGSARQLTDAAPGPLDGIGSHAIRVGDRLFFAGSDGVTGSELHALPFAATDASVLQPFGAGCSTTPNALTASGPATLGSTVTAQLTEASPGATALLFRSGPIGATDLGAGCTLYALQPTLTAVFPIDGLGTGSTALPVPSTPELVGLRLALQAAVPEPAGPFAGAFGLSNALEVIVGP